MGLSSQGSGTVPDRHDACGEGDDLSSIIHTSRAILSRLYSYIYDDRINKTMSRSENHQRSLRGELYHAFTPELVAARRRCAEACNAYNNAGFVSRRKQVELWHK